MKYWEALRIFADIENPEISDSDKGMAIHKVLGLATHNSVTKEQMLKVIRYLFDLCFEEVPVNGKAH